MNHIIDSIREQAEAGKHRHLDCACQGWIDTLLDTVAALERELAEARASIARWEAKEVHEAMKCWQDNA